jgi:hypothetical protein
MMLHKDGFENSLKISTVMGLKNMFSAGGIVLNKREHMWNEAQEQSTCSELYFVLCFILIPCLGVQIQTHKDITFQTPFM